MDSTVASPDGRGSAVLDETDWRLLSALQRDGRVSFADLARQVAMSPSAVAERVRRLEEAGVIAGYQAVVSAGAGRAGDPGLRPAALPDRELPAVPRAVDSTPEIVEAHHVTGEDCFVLKVVARSMRHLEAVTGRIGGLGAVTTSVVYSSPLPRRDLAVEPVATPSARRMAGAEGSAPPGNRWQTEALPAAH